jgi:hypothetical protein
LDARFFRIHDLRCSNCDARHDGPAVCDRMGTFAAVFSCFA